MKAHGKSSINVSINAILKQSDDCDYLFRGRDASDGPDLGNLRNFACIKQEHCKCARHHAAFGHVPNVPAHNRIRELMCMGCVRGMSLSSITRPECCRLFSRLRIASTWVRKFHRKRASNKARLCSRWTLRWRGAPLKQRLAKRQFDKVVAAVNSGAIKMPELDLPSGEDYGVLRPLADTGSVAHFADQARHVPGAQVQSPLRNVVV